MLYPQRKLRTCHQANASRDLTKAILTETQCKLSAHLKL